MPITDESRKDNSNAPNAILEHMRRRIARVGLLVAAISTLVASLVIFFICACSHMR